MFREVWRRWIAGSAASTPVTPAGLPLEHSDKQIERMIEDDGHRYGVDEAAELIRTYELSGKEADGRPWYFGLVRGKTVLLALSAKPTMKSMELVHRVRTMHRKRKPRRDPNRFE